MPFQCSINFLILVRESDITLSVRETTITAVAVWNKFPFLTCLVAQEGEGGVAWIAGVGLAIASVWLQVVDLY